MRNRPPAKILRVTWAQTGQQVFAQLRQNDVRGISVHVVAYRT